MGHSPKEKLKRN